jgi:hypothetical protein
LLLAVVHDDTRVTLCGPVGLGDDPPVYRHLDRGQVERICREALDQPDRHAALRFLRDALPAIQSPLPGVRNEGFLAIHELRVGAPRLAGWAEATARGREVLGRGDIEVLTGLGFALEPLDQVTTLLKASGDQTRMGVAVVLQAGESPDIEAERFNGLSPVSYAMAVADRHRLPYVMVCQGPKLRLYPVGINVGVGRRGRTETFLELHTGLLRDDHAGYLWALVSQEALAPGGMLDHLLEESRRFAGELAVELRKRVYDHVVPDLAEGLVAARELERPTADQLAETYQMAMTVLFRLLFVAYAEDKDLLPYRWNGLYQRRSLKTKATELLDLHHKCRPFDNSDSLWKEVDLLFRSVEDGNREWGVPAYGGELFSRKPEESREGALLHELSLPNAILGPVLHNLLLIESPEGLGPVDFRSLGVREFGTIYEGLLEGELSVAETDLSLDREGYYRPANDTEEPVVHRGQVYLHNRSGARKATGTYFTKEFAVDHLLDEALEPALQEHLSRLDQLADEAAAERFFDFRVADIAMGSAHFLVAAVDRIERQFTRYLAGRPLPGVRAELAQLRAAAVNALEVLAEQIEIEDTQLLRRQIARRCIYGVDLNPVAVSLARLSIWIHTFVPGLPLSLLDHNLVTGNSLVGVGRVDEITEAADPGGASRGTLFPMDAEKLVGAAMEPLTRVARAADATVADVRRARAALKEAEAAVAPAAALCDIVAAGRAKRTRFQAGLVEEWDLEKDRIVGSKEHKEVRKTLEHLPPFHFPVAFPEVFLRDRAGFDVLLGNPPWEKARVEEHGFWARFQPGLRSVPQRQYEQARADLRENRPDLVRLLEQETQEAAALRNALVNGPYPGMGTGDPDLYKAFCWRFWGLIAGDGGRVGVVLPRSALSAKGSAEFRREVFLHSRDVLITTLVNRRTWVFDEVHPQYTIGLAAICKGTPSGRSIGLRGPFASLERFAAGAKSEPTRFAGSDVTSWTDTSALPLLPAEESLEVFTVLRNHPRLDFDDMRSWRCRPYTELHASGDKSLMDLESEVRPESFWSVFKGESFDIWQPDTGNYYAWANPTKVLPELIATQRRGSRSKASPFYEFPKERIGKVELLPCQFPRIAFRDITRATDSRTMRAALIPARVFVTHKAPFFLMPRGSQQDEAYLLGILCSLPFDWFARRFVETGMTYHVLNPLPVPRPESGSPLRLRAVELAGRLAAVDQQYADWAGKVGVECGPLQDEMKQEYIHELDAVVAHLYGLAEAQLAHVFETFHEGWDYRPRLAATLDHFLVWEGRTA